MALIEPIICERENISGHRFYKTPAGLMPSITTTTSNTTSAKIKEILVKWRSKLIATHGTEEGEWLAGAGGRRGDIIHAQVEQYFLNPDLLALDEETLPFWFSIFPFLKKVETPYLIEAPVYSADLGVAGTMDFLCKVYGKTTLVDWKTSAKVKGRSEIGDYLLQAAVYVIATREVYGDRLRLAGIPLPEQAVIVVATPDRDAIEFLVTWDEVQDEISKYKRRRLEYEALYSPLSYRYS